MDIYDTYGISFLRGSYFSLLGSFTAKECVKNDSRLQHGSRYVTNNIRVAERTIELSFLLEGNTRADFIAKYEAFVDKLVSGLVYLKVPSVLRVFKILLSSVRIDKKFREEAALFKVTVIEPNPKDRVVLTS